jgi:hypothetical protein
MNQFTVVRLLRDSWTLDETDWLDVQNHQEIQIYHELEKKTFLFLMKDGVGNGTYMRDLSKMVKYQVAMVMIIPILSGWEIK